MSPFVPERLLTEAVAAEDGLLVIEALAVLAVLIWVAALVWMAVGDVARFRRHHGHHPVRHAAHRMRHGHRE